MREIEILLTQSNFKATAMLLEDENPKLCDEMWRFLEKPLEHDAFHVSHSGEAIVMVPLDLPKAMKEEKPTIYIGRGEIVLNCRPPTHPHQYPNPKHTGSVDELLIFYGRGQPRLYEGPKSVCPIAKISNKHLIPFSKACRDFYQLKRLGKQKVIIRRKE